MPYGAELPTGTVTFLFTDIEGSTRLLQALGPRYAELLEAHQRILRDAFANRHGIELGTEGDSFFVVFDSAPLALAAAADAQHALSAYPWSEGAEVRVRMGLHTGEGVLGGDSYVGLDVHRAARIAAVAHGGQILLSESTCTLAKHGLGDGQELIDLGEHRLKDLLKPERIYQLADALLPRDFPPLSTLNHRPNNLPTQATEFLGRDTETRLLAELLDDRGRLVTITGPGGIGKTRLSLQVAAARTDRYRDGVFFIDLAPVRDPDKAFEAIVTQISLPRSAGAQPLDDLKQQLATKEMMLLLDNAEQVIAMAPGVTELLRACPGLRILATSREPFRVRDEHVFSLSPLSLPDTLTHVTADAAARSEAVRLFIERASAAGGAFSLTDENAALVAEICARLDGLPLAIELAAARLRVFSVKDLCERLRGSLQVVGGGARDLPERHQTLRHTIEWSYDLLDEQERSVFLILSVFATAPLEAVEQVAARIPALRDIDVLDRVSSLVDKSLIRGVNGSGPVRFSMLETIHDFTSEQLSGQPSLEDAARRAHAEYFADLAHASSTRLSDAQRETMLSELQAEIGNFETAWRFWAAAGDLERLEQLLELLWVLYDANGSYVSAVGMAQEVLALLADMPSTPERVQQKIILTTSLARGLLALRGLTKEVETAYERVLSVLDEAGGLPNLYPVIRSLASLLMFRADFEGSRALGQQLLELGDQMEDDDIRADGHLLIGANAISLGDASDGLRHLQECSALFDVHRAKARPFRLGANPAVVAQTTSAFATWLMGEPDRAVEHAARAVHIAEELDHPFTRAYALFHAALFDLWRRDYASVMDRTSRAIAVAESHRYEVWRAVALMVQGTALVGLGEVEDGIALSNEGFVLYREMTTPPIFWPFILMMRARAFEIADRLDEATDLIDQAIEILGDNYDLLTSQIPVLKGDLLLASGKPDDAERWFRRALETSKVAGATTTALRAATRLAKIHREESDVLRAVLDQFDGKMETADVADARAVLRY